MNECVIYNSVEDNELYFNNSAFLYGESVFTSSYLENGSLFFKDEHLKRLRKSSHFLFQFDDQYFFDDLDIKLTKVLKSHSSYNYLRITLFKNHLKEIHYSFLFEKRNITTSTLKINSTTLKQTSFFPSFVKIGNYAYRFKERNESIDSGFDDVLFIDEKNNILELSTSNIFFMMKDKSIVTPILSNNILDGIQRRNFIKFLKDNQFKIIEREINLNELENVIAAVATNCVSQVRNIKQINNSFLEISHLDDIKNDFLKGVKFHD